MYWHLVNQVTSFKHSFTDSSLLSLTVLTLKLNLQYMSNICERQYNVRVQYSWNCCTWTTDDYAQLITWLLSQFYCQLMKGLFVTNKRRLIVLMTTSKIPIMSLTMGINFVSYNYPNNLTYKINLKSTTAVVTSVIATTVSHIHHV